MSWSMLHRGDMSSKVFENFTTCGKKGRLSSSRLPAASNQGSERAKKKTPAECHRASPVSRCPPGGARSSAHTAAGSALAAWSSSQSSPGQSAPQTGRWPPQAEPVTSQRTLMTDTPRGNSSFRFTSCLSNSTKNTNTNNNTFFNFCNLVCQVIL